MLYYFFNFLNEQYNIPGAGMFQYISFRAAMAIILSLFISLIYGKSLINKLHQLQVSDEIRNLGLEGEQQKKGNTYHGWLNYSSCHSYSYFVVCTYKQCLYNFNNGVYRVAWNGRFLRRLY